MYLFAQLHGLQGILVSWPGIKPVPLGVEAPTPNHWTARGVPILTAFKCTLQWHQGQPCCCANITILNLQNFFISSN